ncbi:hypothetical protein [Streptomyces sp. NPDC008001]|uniref:hypothetical protein n=1 Tax=Streptomyces sp. NPDC008001 TaxID=3364804 RepID=UPI0036E57B26
MSIRHVIAAALVVSGALALTACGPTDDDGGKSSGGKNDGKGAVSAAPSQRPAEDKGDKGGKGNGGGKGSCPTLAKGHKYVQVYSVTGAMNDVTAKDATMTCSAKPDNGAAYHAVGDYKTYHWKPGSKVTVLGKNGPEERAEQPAGDQLSGIGHVKLCADPERRGGNMAPVNHTEYCYGKNFYDVAVGSDNTITEMTELYGS